MSNVKTWRKRRPRRGQKVVIQAWDYVKDRKILGTVYRHEKGYVVEINNQLIAGPYGELSIARQSTEQRVEMGEG